MTTILQCRASIGGKPIYDAPRGSRQSNWMEIGQGAVPGTGRVLIRASDWPAISDDANLRLKVWSRRSSDEWESDPSIDLQVRSHAAIPFVQGPKSTGTDGLLELHLLDARQDAAFNSSVSLAFNVQEPGFPVSGGNPIFYDATLNSGSPFTWEEICDALGVTHADFVFPAIQPRNLVFSGVTRAEAIDRLSLILQCAVHFDWTASEADWFHLIDKDGSVTANDDEWDDFTAFPILNSMVEVNDTRFPATLRFNFRVVPAGPDPFLAVDRWYLVNRSTGYGTGSTVRDVTPGYWFGVGTGAGVSNAAELDLLADYYVAANVIDRYVDRGDVKQGGIVAFQPDGKYRRVLWTFDAHEISTHVRVNSDLPIRAEVRRSEPFQAEPLDDTVVVRTIDGRTLVTDVAPVLEFDAIITGHTLIGANRWRYAWCTAHLEGDIFVRDDPVLASGSTSNDYAINGDETGNSDTYKAAGTRLDGPDFPPGMKVIPIGGDFEEFSTPPVVNNHDVHVRMRRGVDENGDLRYEFNRGNDIDGPCA